MTIKAAILNDAYYATFDNGERHQVIDCELDADEVFILDKNATGWAGPSCIGGPSEYRIVGTIAGVPVDACFYNQEAFNDELARITATEPKKFQVIIEQDGKPVFNFDPLETPDFHSARALAVALRKQLIQTGRYVVHVLQIEPVRRVYPAALNSTITEDIALITRMVEAFDDVEVMLMADDRPGAIKVYQTARDAFIQEAKADGWMPNTASLCNWFGELDVCASTADFTRTMRALRRAMGTHGEQLIAKRMAAAEKSIAAQYTNS